MVSKSQLIVGAIVCGLVYLSWDYVSIVRLVYIGKNCFNKPGYRGIDTYKTEKEKLKAANQLCDCIRAGQTYLDKMIIKMPQDCESND